MLILAADGMISLDEADEGGGLGEVTMLIRVSVEAEFPIDEVDEVREPGDVAMLPLVLVLVAKVGWVE